MSKLQILGGMLATPSEPSLMAQLQLAVERAAATKSASLSKDSNFGKVMFRPAVESFTKDDVDAARSSLNTLATLADSIVTNTNLEIPASMRKSLEMMTRKPAAVSAATMAAAAAARPDDYAVTRVTKVDAVGSTRMSVSRESFRAQRQARWAQSKESYAKTSINTMVAANFIYHLAVVNQFEYAENLFPMVVVGHDVQTIAVSLTTTTVFDNKTLDVVGGTVTDRGDRNVLLGLRDANLLKSDTLRLLPVWRATNASMFVPVSEVPTRTELVDGTVPVETTWLRCGVVNDILALSQTDAMIAKGLPDAATDTIEPGLALQRVLIKIPTGNNTFEYFAFNTRRVSGSTFYQTYGREGNMALTLNAQNMLFQKGASLVPLSGTPTTNTALQAIANDNLLIYFNMNVGGMININTRQTNVYGGGSLSVRRAQIRGSNGQLTDLALTDSRVVAINAALAAGQVYGYEVDGQRANLNHRERGQLLDIITHSEILNINSRAPVTVTKPTSQSGDDDSLDLTNLIEVCRIRMGNAATDTIFETASILAGYKGATTTPDLNTQILGLASKLVTVHYDEDTIDVSSQIASLESKDVFDNMVATFTNQVRERVFQMIVNTNYAIALESQNGGVRPKIVAYVVCDPYLAQFLRVTGDLRTISEGIDIKVMSNYDNRFQDKFMITLGREIGDAGSNGSVDLLHTGVCLYSAELVTTLENAARAGQISKELTVQPRYAYYWNLPIMEMLTVEGIPQTFRQKISVAFTETSAASIP